MRLGMNRRWTWGIALLLCLALTVPASAQIVGAGAGGYINFKSGFPPLNASPGFVTTGQQRVPVNGPYLFLQRWHLSPQGYAEGGTAIRVLQAPFSYWFQVPTNSYLLQRRNACALGALPAELFTHFDAVFNIGAGGFPAHIATMAYPVVGQNGPGAGSYSIFWARLRFGMRAGPNAPIIFTGTGVIAYFDFRPGAAFFAIPTAAVALPAVPAGWQFLAWGDILFQYRGCPLFFGAAADGLKVSGSPDGQIGVQDDGATPPFDPSLPEITITDPQNVFMDMPIPAMPTDGTGVMLMETSEDASHNVNHRPQISPIPDQRGMEGSPLSFSASAVDMDGDPLTWSLANAPAGMSIDSFGNVTWTPAAGQAGVYQVTVRANDSHGALAQTDEQVVTVTIEGTNHAPWINNGDVSVDEGNTVSFPISGYDPDQGQILTYKLVSQAPAGLSFSPSGVVTWTPTEDQGPRDYTIRVRVTDNGTPNLWQERPITIHVNERNQPPVVQPVPPLQVSPGQTITYQVVASDSDTRPGPQGGIASQLTYSLSGSPAGATINSETGLFTWTPSSTQVGSYSFAVMVTDNYGASGYSPIQVQVGSGGPIKPPPPK